MRQASAIALSFAAELPVTMGDSNAKTISLVPSFIDI
jgi:hypothetical protein